MSLPEIIETPKWLFRGQEAIHTRASTPESLEKASPFSSQPLSITIYPNSDRQPLDSQVLAGFLHFYSHSCMRLAMVIEQSMAVRLYSLCFPQHALRYLGPFNPPIFEMRGSFLVTTQFRV